MAVLNRQPMIGVVGGRRRWLVIKETNENREMAGILSDGWKQKGKTKEQKEDKRPNKTTKTNRQTEKSKSRRFYCHGTDSWETVATPHNLKEQSIIIAYLIH